MFVYKLGPSLFINCAQWLRNRRQLPSSKCNLTRKKQSLMARFTLRHQGWGKQYILTCQSRGHGFEGLQNLLCLYNDTWNFPCLHSGSVHFLKEQRVFIHFLNPALPKVWKLASQRWYSQDMKSWIFHPAAPQSIWAIWK